MDFIELPAYLIFTAGFLAGAFVCAGIFIVERRRQHSADVLIWLDSSGSLMGSDKVIAGVLETLERLENRAHLDRTVIRVSVQAFSHMLGVREHLVTFAPGKGTHDLLSMVQRLREVAESAHGGTYIDLVYENTPAGHEAIVITDMQFLLDVDGISAQDLERISFVSIEPVGQLPQPTGEGLQVRPATGAYLEAL